MKLSWYIGHMAKTSRLLEELKIIDLIIEVIDSRAINSSSNQELITKFKNKEIIKIATKTDLSDVDKSKHQDILFINKNDVNINKLLINKFNNIFKSKFEKYKSKGLLTPQFYVLIVGLPNVGKSTLINLLIKKNKLIVENRAGVTKKIQLIKISNNYFCYDTPGVMIKDVKTDEEGYILSLINVVNKNIIPLEEVLNYWFNYVIKNIKYVNLIEKYFNIQLDNFQNFINNIKEKYNFSTIQQAYDFLYQNIIDGKICKISYQ